MSLIGDIKDGLNPDWDGTLPIVSVLNLPPGKVFLFTPRRPSETDEEWGSRCALAVNIGKFGE